MIRKAAMLSAVFVLALVAVGCGRSMKTVYIQDGRCRTEVTVPVKADVGQILEEAELTLGERDELSLPLEEVPDAEAEIGVARYAKATVVTEEGKKEVELFGGTVGDALKKSGVFLGKNDLVNVDSGVFLSELNGDIVVTKQFRIAVTADGKTAEIVSPKATVRRILEDNGWELGELDRVTPDADTLVKADTEIVIQRVEKKQETETVSIPYSTQKQYSSSLASGASQTNRAGVKGKKEVTYEVTYVDGKETDRSVIKETIVKQPVDAIVVYGTKQAAPSGEGSGGKTVVSRVRVEDCDGSGHGYYIVTYEDGSVDFVDF